MPERNSVKQQELCLDIINYLPLQKSFKNQMLHLVKFYIAKKRKYTLYFETNQNLAPQPKTEGNLTINIKVNQMKPLKN